MKKKITKWMLVASTAAFIMSVTNSSSIAFAFGAILGMTSIVLAYD